MNQNEDILPYVRVICGEIRRLKLAEASISGFLTLQLAGLMMEPRQRIDPMTILDEIARLHHDPGYAHDHIRAFTRQKVLDGLYKAHFFDSPFMVRNIKDELFTREGKVKPRLETLMASNNIVEGGTPSKQDLANFANQIVSESLYERSKRSCGLTGEWVVMDEMGGRYRYLCLATHKLATSDPETFVQLAEDGKQSMESFQRLYEWSIQE